MPYSLTFEQYCPPTPKQEEEKPPFLIPIKIGLLKPNGEEIEFINPITGAPEQSTVLELSQRKQTFTFSNIDGKPTPSLFRNFSAPVKIKAECLTTADKINLIKHDSDAFVKWDCMQDICINEIKSQLANYIPGEPLELSEQFAHLYSSLLEDRSIATDYKTKLLTLPSYNYMLKQIDNVNPVKLNEVLSGIKQQLAIQNESYLNSVVNQMINNPDIDALFSIDKPNIAKQRDLFLFTINLLCHSKNNNYHELALDVTQKKSNFTNVYNSYMAYFCTQGESFSIVNSDINKDLYEKFKDNDSLLQKWLVMQGMIPAKDAIDHIENLANGTTPGFDLSHPHQCYRLLRTFVSNNPEFHNINGRGYKVIANCLLKLDVELKNSKVSTRIAAAMVPSENMSELNKTLANRELARIRQDDRISTSLREVIDKSLAGTEFDPNSSVKTQTLLFTNNPGTVEPINAQAESSKHDTKPTAA